MPPLSQKNLSISDASADLGLGLMNQDLLNDQKRRQDLMQKKKAQSAGVLAGDTTLGGAALQLFPGMK